MNGRGATSCRVKPNVPYTVAASHGGGGRISRSLVYKSTAVVHRKKDKVGEGVPTGRLEAINRFLVILGGGGVGRSVSGVASLGHGRGQTASCALAPIAGSGSLLNHQQMIY